MLPLAMALGISVPTIELLAFIAAPQVVAQSSVVLKLRRLGDRVDVVVDGVSADARVVSQSSSSTQWRGQLRAAAPLPLGRSQEVALAKAGLQSIRLSPNNQGELELDVKASQGMVLPDPQIRVDGNSLIVSFTRLQRQTMALASGGLDLSRPGRVQQPAVSPPLRARASAPPLGDMAVGSMLLNNRSYVSVKGPPVSLTLNNAPAKDTLMSLAQLGGYGFVYVGDPAAKPDPNEEQVNPVGVTMVFRNERFDRVFNSVLLASGLQAKLDGNTLMVGVAISSKTFGPQMSKVFRLNQVSPELAGKYLGSLGADIKQVSKSTTRSSQNETDDTGFQQSSKGTSTSTTRDVVTSFGASEGPLLGLNGTTDGRLGTITLIGDSRLIAVAESYLKQIDLRQRQVALSVKILDIAMSNDSQINNSFAFRSGNAFIVSNNGQLLANFGTYKPPGAEAGGLPGRYSAVEGTTPLSGTGSLTGGAGFLDMPNKKYPLGGSTTSGPGGPGPYRPDFGTYDNPLQPGVSEVDDDAVTYQAPTRFRYPVNELFDFLTAQIQSTSTKVLASPTLILQEGPEEVTEEPDGIGRKRSNEAVVSVGTSLVTSYKVNTDQNGNSFCTPVFSNAGLTFGARVDKIDDNGFVTFSMSPEISAAVGSPGVIANCGNISTINSRTLDTGKIRVRDGQTLILTGVISDSDVQAVTKWPILGDIPLIGQFFRSSGGDRAKNELVILVTPRIIDDTQGGNYGYGYLPNLPAARQVMSGS